MPDRFEKTEVTQNSIAALLNKKQSIGYAAVRRGKMVAYFLGTYTNQSWGHCGWVYLPGSALAEGESVEINQDLVRAIGK